MFLRRTERTHFSFDEVPEVSKYGAEFLYSYLRTRVESGSSGANFGAYIIRQAGKSTAQRWYERMGGADFDWNGRGYDAEHSSLHQDNPKAIYGISAHYTRGNPLRFIILPGTKIIGISIFNMDVNAANIFMNGFAGVSPHAFEEVHNRGLSTIVNEDDLVIFDHRQPHAFSMIGEGSRESFVAFKSGPQQGTSTMPDIQGSSRL